MLDEDAATEMAQLTMQRQQLLIKKATQDQTIDRQIAQLDKLILQKGKQQELEAAKLGQQQSSTSQPASQNQPQGNRTIQPGSTGAQTPGSAPTMQR